MEISDHSLNLSALENNIARIALPLHHKYLGYHNQEHALKTLAAAKFLAHSIGEKLSVAQTLAIFFHDCVFIPGYSGTESLSALLMVQQICRPENSNLKISEKELEEASECIQATSNHLGSEIYPSHTNLVLDADLQELANPNYDAFYNTQQRLLDESSYIYGGVKAAVTGQKKFLRLLIERPTIFRSDPNKYPVLEIWERYAQRNLQAYCFST